MAVTIDRVGSKSKTQVTDQPAEFERQFQENWSRVHGLLYRLVGDPDEAEDLALETFWRLYTQPPSQTNNVSGWLYRVAVRLGYNALRAHKRRGQYEQEAGKLVLERSVTDPANEADLAEQRQRVRKVLGGMKPRSAQILVLRHSGFSYTEIGAAMDVPVSSVGTLLARAEREFEKRFKQAYE
jgi:RNA polymerase sigma-70 factor (ECF subfamily)